ncbi:MAG: glycosyltransferase family 2 protein [Oligoflexia bacterium]|nr:glycosyltransferase family 2 protein [Oligoflexia bacterium]
MILENNNIPKSTRLISFVTPCYNEEENVELLYFKIKDIVAKIAQNTPTNYEHIFIDNSSTDRTMEILKNIAATDKNVKIIINNKNYGHIRSPYHALMQARGDAIIQIVADLQDPPELIPQFIEKWESGYKIVVGVKKGSAESKLMFTIRKLYYFIAQKLSDSNTSLINNFTGFGLYDKEILATLKQWPEPYPYFRGMISEIGYDIAQIEYLQPARHGGKTKNNFFTLFDMALLGVTSYSKVPLRMMTISGFILSLFGLFSAFIYLFYKLAFWQKFSIGVAPIAIGLFLFSSVQLLFLGIIGEYIGSVYTIIKGRPHVIEKERINF